MIHSSRFLWAAILTVSTFEYANTQTQPSNTAGSTSSNAGTFYVGGGVSPPIAIYKPQPEFSEEARKAKYEGVCTLGLIVGTDGRPSNIRVLSSLGMGLDEKAIEAVKNWKFEPAMKDGHPVRVEIAVEVDFHLESDKIRELQKQADAGLARRDLGLAVGQQENSKWQEYVYPGDGFAITTPTAPKPQPSPALPGATAYPVQFKDENVFVVLRVKTTSNCIAFLSQYKENLLRGKDSEIDPASLKDLTLGGHPGFESKRKVWVNTILDRWYCADGHLYAFSVRWPTSQPFPSAATRVLNSFRLLTKDTDP